MFPPVMGEITLPGHPSGDWREALRALARSDHVLFQKHPWLILLGIQPGIGPNTQRHNDFGLRILDEGLHLNATPRSTPWRFLEAKTEDPVLARAPEARLRLVGDTSFEVGLDRIQSGIEARF